MNQVSIQTKHSLRKEISGQTKQNPKQKKRKTSRQLLKRETYQEWDFENVWFMEEDVLLPSLVWEVPEPLIGILFTYILCFLLTLKIR